MSIKNQIENISKLIADLKSIKEGSEVTQEQKDKLKEDVKAVLQDAVRPSEESVQALIDALKKAWEDGLHGDDVDTVLKAFLAVMESANISIPDLKLIAADLKDILTSANIDEQEKETIINDLKAIAEEFRN